MNGLYVTSIDTFSGKTALCLGLARHLQATGKTVGYIKPVSFQPTRTGGTTMDEDAEFVCRVLSLTETPAEFSPIVVTAQMLTTQLREGPGRDFLADIARAYQQTSQGKDFTILEGAASLREGYVMGLSAATVAQTLNVPVLTVVRWASDSRLVDDALAAQTRLGQALLGVLLNHIPQPNWQFAQELARPYLERHGIPVFGCLPLEARLMAMSVGELVETLGGQVLVAPDKMDTLVENIMVGAMAVEAALPRFRRQQNKAVVTGGDRTDLQLAALETSTRALILTGNLQPNPQVLERAEESGVPVILVRGNTLETVEAIERTFGHTRLGYSEKLEQFEKLLAQHLDFERLLGAIKA